MTAENPRGAHDIVCDTFLPDPVSLEKEGVGSWPRTSGQIQEGRQVSIRYSQAAKPKGKSRES